MQLTHTSPAEIEEITEDGRFGAFLCFSAEEYVMTAGAHVTYHIDIDESEIISAGALFYHSDAPMLTELVQDVIDLIECDAETAERYLSQSDDCGDAEKSWDIQRLTAEAARALGYRGVSMSDEQGTVYMIDMRGRAGELRTGRQ
jgi:hypothetical protein